VSDDAYFAEDAAAIEASLTVPTVAAPLAAAAVMDLVI
jgi:hypothetical protein